MQQIDVDSQFYTINGKWAHSSLNRISFAIPGCIDPSLLQPLIPFLPTSPDKANPKDDIHVPPEVAAPVQRLLDDLAEQSESVYRKNAPVLDTAYTVLADSTKTRMMTLAQIAKALLSRGDPAWRPSSSDLLAVRKSLNHNAFRFRSDQRSHRLTNIFAIRPKDDVQVVETVHGWIREYFEFQANAANHSNDSKKPASLRTEGTQNIHNFLEKARILIAKSRNYRDANNGGLGPSKTRDGIEAIRALAAP